MSANIKTIMTAIALASALAAPAGAFAQPRAHAHASATAVTTDASGQRGPLVQDCVHVTFPQCGGSVLY